MTFSDVEPAMPHPTVRHAVRDHLGERGSSDDRLTITSPDPPSALEGHITNEAAAAAPQYCRQVATMALFFNRHGYRSVLATKCLLEITVLTTVFLLVK
ncbi:hypothetical protein CEXT_487871 [Caerostris extrusa]|uniref:Uncharacterized protein n=1 Tax=Caerostris extrusa TaxID=172846 RepID=A0AAV4UII3_CAEEX|nr:hypothetical protein CEXT_487871 [Caerostris extrusa]